MSLDRAAEWKAAQKRWKEEHGERAEVRNEHGETLGECQARFIREHGTNAENRAMTTAMMYEGMNHQFPRNEHLVIFYRVIARLVRIDR